MRVVVHSAAIQDRDGAGLVPRNMRTAQPATKSCLGSNCVKLTVYLPLRYHVLCQN
jgi:hypothetical protein